MPPQPTTVDSRTLADELGVAIATVRRNVRLGRFPHVRLGPAPPPGRRDVRPVGFTPDQVAQIKATYLHVEVVPAAQGTA